MTSEEASLLTYDTDRDKFESVYERNKFYRGLFGYRQTVKKNGKKYEYDKEGLMDRIPSIRIDDSVFILANSHRGEVERYFAEWGEKVTHHFFTVVLEDADLISRIKDKGETE